MIVVGLSYIIAQEFFDALPIHQFQVDTISIDIHVTIYVH